MTFDMSTEIAKWAEESAKAARAVLTATVDSEGYRAFIQEVVKTSEHIKALVDDFEARG